MLQMIDTTYRRSSSLYCHQTTDRIGTGLRANPVRGRKMAAVQYRWLLRQQVTGISQLPPRLALQERKLQEV
ncbi:hypothetical protein, partial [Escherichia coli]|uniref:hypothetical protein n=1 Tax=Escherichia coli TaxID=562 RepID=UPI001939CD7B